MDNNQQSIKRPKPVVLAILDGWGVSSDSISNAISQSKIPNFDKLAKNYFCTTLQASGVAVGLPYGEMGNSEVGHLNLGAGKIVYQNLERINKDILDGKFFDNAILLKAINLAKKNKKNLHLIGLISNGGVHSSFDHLLALLELAKKQDIKNVFIHCILDGRDMPYNSGLEIIGDLQNKIKEIGVGKISTVIGRFYAMDRDIHWERIKVAYNLMVNGIADKKTNDILSAIKEFYDQKIYDEEMKPIFVDCGVCINDNDSVIFFNFRPDRARELTKAFVLPGFEKFERGKEKNLYFVTLTQYEKQLPVDIAYAPENVDIPLADVISESGLKQLHVAETEKYAHITYFLNGGKETKFDGEEWALVPSLRIDSYADKPEMSANAIKDKVTKEINSDNFDFIAINFANADMVAHTGNMKATIKAIETIDKAIGEIAGAILAKKGVFIITSDHGNAEELINLKTGEIDKEHSNSPVPFLIVGENFKNQFTEGEEINLSLLTPSGILADVAPTILKILNIPQPKEMTGRSLI
jgi:2,3-bisphosphoglycerate-independent phosphoglycerate mutase